MYFVNYPKVLIKNNEMTDITASVSFFEQLKGTNSCLEYYISDGDTPESISNTFYGSQELSWTILMLNHIKDINREWPLSSLQINDYLSNKYGETSALFLKLDSIKKYDIQVGDKICLFGSTNNKAEVVEWIPSLSKLIIKYIDGNPYQKNNTISFLNTPNEQLAIVGRSVQYSLDSLNHFELQNNYLDPLRGFLQSYINNDSNEYVITDYENEINNNDKKRFIYLVKQDLVLKVVKDYYTLLQRTL
jgi:hypothetical protein